MAVQLVKFFLRIMSTKSARCKNAEGEERWKKKENAREGVKLSADKIASLILTVKYVWERLIKEDVQNIEFPEDYRKDIKRFYESEFGTIIEILESLAQ